MPRRRVRIKKLPAWLALLALAVRLVLPGLHTHGHAPARSVGAVAACCACGIVHGAPARGALPVATAAVTVEAHTCLACELELGKPPAPPSPAAATPAAAPRADGHPCRAPPTTRRPSV